MTQKYWSGLPANPLKFQEFIPLQFLSLAHAFLQSFKFFIDLLRIPPLCAVLRHVRHCGVQAPTQTERSTLEKDCKIIIIMYMYIHRLSKSSPTNET